MKQLPAFHCHPQSLDTGSTIKSFIKREKELNSGFITATDHGTVSGAPEVYNLAKNNNLIPILGVEAYISDKLDTEENAISEYAYMHVTIHARDYAAYQQIGRLLSFAPREKHGSEQKPLFSWKDLEGLANYNITLGSGCLAGVVQRPLVAGLPDIAIKNYERLRSFAPNHFYVEVFPHTCDHEWVSGVFLTLLDGSTKRYWVGKTIRLNNGGKVLEGKANHIIQKCDFTQETFLIAQKDYNKWVDVEPLQVIKARASEGEFIHNECSVWAPNGDLQKLGNDFVIALATKYKDPIVVSDDSHLAYPEHKIAQDLKLLASSGPTGWRFYTKYYRMSSENAWEHFKNVGVSEKIFESWVDNTCNWASQFGWGWPKKPQLPSNFYPSDTLRHTIDLIKEVGRMQWDNKEWCERLAAELKMLHNNDVLDLLPYFFVCQEANKFLEENEILTGPGRGSAGGLLLSYLLGITHVQPLKYNLSKERFLTTTRIKSGKLPDIDLDSGNRDFLFGSDSVEQLKVKLDNGTERICLKSQKVKTVDGGIYTVREACDKGLEIIEWINDFGGGEK
jgi:DNA polymerase III alpha subunit